MAFVLLIDSLLISRVEIKNLLVFSHSAIGFGMLSGLSTPGIYRLSGEDREIKVRADIVWSELGCFVEMLDRLFILGRSNKRRRRAGVPVPKSEHRPG